NGTVIDDTIDTGSKNIITGSLSTSNNIQVNGDVLPVTSGVTVDGAAMSGDLTIDIAAMIYGGDLADTISRGDRGNDIFGGAGNDSLTGGARADWIFGQDGDDTIVSGTASGDYLSGGAGNDSINATLSDSAALDGGGGNDTLVGGKGDDILSVEVGSSS